jgi:hypothetical protein
MTNINVSSIYNYAAKQIWKTVAGVNSKHKGLMEYRLQ